ncbi:uncharacterized protein BX664DRAFT_343084 [Halteromyces radiatus]|uniref:uncharacterized protein n=1 Tax=Halteromyces radiatus TaxID=101107 RepID=UPI00221E9B8D|nr:uncharacterized protein BX664DRAFT_343084 [Halteromyces radiatus]KAI8078920.1 hypothetical protein BX664DRAFT_343084 [Halteromyces radiatus]
MAFFKVSPSVFQSSILQQSRQLSNKTLRPKKFTSILSHVPPRPRSGWQIFLRQRLPAFKQANGKIPTAEATKTLGEEWKSLTDAQKKEYAGIFEREVKVHEDAVQKALLEATPREIHAENILRRKHNLTLLKDPKQPKRPLNGYMLYLDHLRTHGPSDFKSMPVAQQAHEGSSLYKKLDAHEKQKFENRAKKNQQAYVAAIEKYKAQI